MTTKRSASTAQLNLEREMAISLATQETSMPRWTNWCAWTRVGAHSRHHRITAFAPSSAGFQRLRAHGLRAATLRGEREGDLARVENELSELDHHVVLAADVTKFGSLGLSAGKIRDVEGRGRGGRRWPIGPADSCFHEGRGRSRDPDGSPWCWLDGRLTFTFCFARLRSVGSGLRVISPCRKLFAQALGCATGPATGT